VLSPDRPSSPLRALPVAALPAPVAAATAALAADHEAAYFYDPEIAAHRARALKARLPEWAELAFAVKANGFAPVLSALAPEVDGFDVSSGQELRAVRAAVAGAPRGTRLLSSGPGKTPALIEELVVADSMVVNVESGLELARVARAAQRVGRVAPITLRVNPARVPLTGDLRMGGAASQFGVDELDVGELAAAARALESVDLLGFHVHGVSGNLDAGAHVAYVAWCLEWSAAAARRHGIDLRLIDVGGGIGFCFAGERAFDLDAFGAGLRALAPPPGARVVFEPGRWIAAPCGWYAAPVTDVKRSRGTSFAVLRGGIHHFALPASWGLLHRICVVPMDDWPAELTRPELRDACVTIVGELCAPEDTLAHDVAVDRLRPGDVVVFPDAGSYGWEFALQQFLGHPPARRVVVGSKSALRRGQHP
jgi:diaminopimelate decarboxylase